MDYLDKKKNDLKNVNIQHFKQYYQLTQHLKKLSFLLNRDYDVNIDYEINNIILHKERINNLIENIILKLKYTNKKVI